MTDEYVVNVEGLNKSFAGKPAVIDLSLKVKRGEIFGFLGPNGSGKTTTIRMLCGLMTPDSGQGETLGYNIRKHVPEIKQLVGYVPQTFSLYQDLTVEENLKFIARVYEEHDYPMRVKDIMVELGLDRYKNILSGRLSGGWKQRLSLAAALIHDPQLLLLDEPTAGVDPKARRDFWNYITYLATKGMTALVSTHYMDEAERCNRLAYIVNGRLLTEGTIPEIIDKVGLKTYSGTGKNIPKFAHELQYQKGVEQVVIWGNELRIVGTDERLLKEATEKYKTLKWEEVTTSLEAIFIHLVPENGNVNKI